MLQRYYQVGEYDEWKIAPEKNQHDPWKFAADMGASRVSIMSIEGDLDIMGPEGVAYAGPLFFDIDDADLTKALASGVELCDKLLSLGVAEEDIEVHLSGSKGIHIFIDARIFDPKCKPMKGLPKIYKRLATSVYVPGMDMQVYSGSKGRLVRPPNSKRPDGRYKILSSVSELRDLTAEAYAELVSQPRDIVPVSRPLMPSGSLKFLLQQAVKDLKEDGETLKSDVITDLAPLEGAVPPCIEDLANGNRDTAKPFNQIALNVGCWTARASLEPAILDSLQTRIVEACPSSKGETVAARKRKMDSLHYYIMSQDKGYDFSCGSMKSVLSGRPCNSCPVSVSITNTSKVSEHVFMHERGGQWYSDRDCTTLAATFTIDRDAVIKDEQRNIIEGAIINILVPAQGRTFRLDDFSESAFRNKGNFKQAVEGIDGAVFFGSDNDVSRIRYTICKDELLSGAEMKEKFKTDKIGVIYRRRHGPVSAVAEGHVGRFTYVEEGATRNSSGVPDTHIYQGAQQPFPRLLRLDWDKPVSETANQAFSLLMKCNLPSVISPMLGWYLLAHIKNHVYQIEHRGALLCISGVAGTGKNSLTAVMQRLSGLEGEDALHTLEAPNSTKLPFQQALSNTTTVPRVINELNPKSVTKNQYRDLLELLKAAFDSQSISRGRIGGNTDKNGANVSTVSWSITAPVITLSEEPIHLPAVRQRAVMVDMTPQGHDFGYEAFMALEKNADDLLEIARVLVEGALSTTISEVHTLLKAAELPPEMESYNIPARLKFGYQSILMAYDWAIEVLGRAVGFSDDNLAALRKMRQEFISYMQDNSQRISRDSTVTEVDKVLKDFAVMAYNSQDSSAKTNYALEKGKHYAYVDNILYLDILIIYPQYQRFKAGAPEPMSIVTAEAFLQTVRSMDYYLSDRTVQNLLPTNGRPILSLDGEKLQERDIYVTMFI